MRTPLYKLKNLLRRHTPWLQEYLTELSVVVISIAVTFYGEDKIEQYHQRQEDREVMQMMLNELHENRLELESLRKRCDKDVLFSTLLSDYLERNEIPTPDTLELFSRYHYLYPQWILKRNAFDVMKNSGVMQRMDDKELLMEIFDCYDQIEIVSEKGKNFTTERFNMIMQYISARPVIGEAGTLEQWQRIALDVTYKDYLCLRFRYIALNLMGFGERAYNATDSVIQKIADKYDITD